MTREQEIRDQIKALESKIKPLEAELRNIYIDKVNTTEKRIKDAENLKDKFELNELLFSSHSRCMCGAGLAYPEGIGINGHWYCSSILLGRAKGGTSHDSPFPFAFYEIKSENQPSAMGATTRPNE